jgi:glycosyltransferase involved in cell wall biosynthesis
MTGILTFTSLFPSGALPHHGLFVRERMGRVVRTLGCPWHVVAPRPKVPRLLRWLSDPRLATLPTSEIVDGVCVDHPPYPHWPGISLGHQARRMARAARDAVAAATATGSWILDAHYLYPDGVAAAAIAEELSLPYVLTARGSDLNLLGKHPAVAPQIRQALRSAQSLVTVSDDLAKQMVSLGELDPDRVQVVRNGVDLDRFCPGDRLAARRALHLPESIPLILAVGRLVRAKGFHLAARALTHLPDANLVLVGEGPDRRPIAATAAGRCHFLGSLAPDQVAVAYRACNVLVLPSQREGWPNVVNEALASGLPVVASAVGSLPEILSDPSVGALVPQGEVDPLVAAVTRFLREPPDPARVAAFAKRYSWDEPVARLVELFRGIWPE